MLSWGKSYIGDNGWLQAPGGQREFCGQKNSRRKKSTFPYNKFQRAIGLQVITFSLTRRYEISQDGCI